jgi:hypothetical protein
MEFNVVDYSTRDRILFTYENPFTGSVGKVFDNFHDLYEPDLIVRHLEKKPKLMAPTKRACRFCFREYPEVTFRKTAHIFPRFMENRNIIHDCECDSCNALFGTYEDSFSKFMGMRRTTEFIKGQSGIPSFKSGDGKFTMRYAVDNEGKHLLKLSGSPDEINGVEGGLELRALKQPYVPINVMKCLYKIGYSIVDPIDLAYFNPTRKIITTNELDHLLTNFAGAVRFTLPHPAHSPMAVRFKKKGFANAVANPSTVISIHFGRYTYQFFLVDNRDTFMFAQDEKFTFIFCPPPFTDNQDQLTTEKIDLSGSEKKYGEMDSVLFQFDFES